jgi:hypothetical protein
MLPRRDRSTRATRAAVAGIALFGAVLGLAVTAFVLSRDDEGTANGRDAATPGAAPQAAVRLLPLAQAGGATGTASLTGRGRGALLRLDVSGLPPREEAYEIWLFNSVSDAEPVARVVRGRFELEARLPADPADYRFLDISREPFDGNPNHSGESLLRAPTSELLGR